MIKIAICHGDLNLRLQALEMLSSYLDRRDSSGEARAFQSEPELLDSIRSGSDFDLYILDALMPGPTGIDLCVRLRELGGSGAIIRLTSPGGHASEAFRDQALGCLLLPLDPDTLSQELDRVLDLIARRQSDCVSVSTRGGARKLPLSELLYVDLHNRVLRYHKLDGSTAASLTLRTSFQKAVAPLLSNGRFFRCGSSFAVNLHHVRGMREGSLLLDNGGEVPLTRGMLGEARRRWASYWRGDSMADLAAS